MLHTKFHENQPTGSGEDTLSSMYLLDHIQNLVKDDPVVSEKSMF